LGSGLLVNTNTRRVDHLNLAAMSRNDGILQLIPVTCLPPAVEAIGGKSSLLVKLPPSSNSLPTKAKTPPPKGRRFQMPCGVL
jgi:hypothetical protein